jgi:hypothetical protein
LIGGLVSIACIAPRRPAARAAVAALAAGLLGAAVVVVVTTGAGWAWVAAACVAPDVALLLGAGRGLAPGQLHPRAVPLYNALHHPAGPLVLTALWAVGLAGAGPLAAALAWGAHIAMDRAAGYGMRTRNGHQAR